MKRLVFFCFLLLCLCSCSPTPNCAGSANACPRVLFIGNSYTYVNDLPGTFVALAKSGGHSVQTGMDATGGWTLANHLNSAQTLGLLQSSHWDFVVLQEQSQIPSVESLRSSEMYPAARALVQKIRQAGAQPIFFLTWAHRGGWPENNLPDYESMQLQINQGYMAIANELIAPVAPVGYAWLTAWLQNPEVNLWQADNSHPTEQGTYLAACVFYAVIFRQSPENLSYRGNLPSATAGYLQSLAANTVLHNPTQWNLP
ncbi:MAG: DUF4886 domain-containing protein [Anaerolineales bacterium]